MRKGSVFTTKALTQHDKVCFQCILPECDPRSPHCAYWAGAPCTMRHRTRVPPWWLQANPVQQNEAP